MKPWVIVLASALAAIAAAAGVTLPRLAVLPHGAILPRLLPLLPVVVVTALAGYALCAILLTAGDLVAACLLLRHRLARMIVQSGASASDWIAAFEASGLQRIAPELAAAAPSPTGAGRAMILRERFHPFAARREVARLYHVLAARSHFFSAVIVLTAAIALGVAQQHGALQLPLGPIPTVPACLMLVGLVLLAVLGRLSVDVAAEPLIDLVSRLPAEPAATALLRRAVALLEAGAGPGVVRDGAGGAAAWRVPDRVVGLVEDGHRALVAAIEHLSATTDRFARATRSALDGLEAALRSGEQRPAAEIPSFDVAALERLHAAIGALTATLERLPRPAPATQRLTGTEIAVAPRDTDPDLASELKKLLQEIETAS
ncbi:MAG: hypothetical protein ACREE2_12850 [Stellaceae bacterium]